MKIAIIDTGIDPNHPDLAAKIVDPINFFTGSPTDYVDRIGHGTWTAGIAAAITNNRTGVAGTSFNTANIIPIRVGDTSIPLSAVISGILYAVLRGAKVINMSLGFVFFSVLLQSAIDFAWDNGLVIIASAGNNGNEQVQYPAGNNRVLAVSATDKANDLAFFSTWGVDIGVAAPGVAILATVPTYTVPDFSFLNYDAADGTSASAPFVSGVAALLFALDPSLTNQQVIQIIERSARPLDEDEEDERVNPPHFPEQPLRAGNAIESSNNCQNDVDRSNSCDDKCNNKCEPSKPSEIIIIPNRPVADLSEKAWDPFFGYGLLNAGKAVRLLKQSQSSQSGLGSFYGQVVSQSTGLPIGGVTVSARVNGVTKREYVTKTNVPTFTILDTDGMFRLFNLPRGTYSIFVGSQQVQTAQIVPGADTILRLLV
ncbi:MAG TPA: S8 family serine peptidase [Syntrophomonadaceae bacterium]|nr:S8 family serine peptidase [Syntrophomonadaceae bacterium]